MSLPWQFQNLRLNEGQNEGNLPRTESEIEQDIQAELEHLKKILEERKIFAPGEDYSDGKYGLLKLNEINDQRYTYVRIKDIGDSLVGNEVWMRGRIQMIRENDGQCMVVLKKEGKTIQILASVNDTISPQMVEFISKINKESIIDVLGTIIKLDEAAEGCTQNLYQVYASEVWLVSAAASPLPLAVESEDKKGVNQKIKLDHRVLDLRTPANNAIFRLQAVICQLFRNELNARGFEEIHTPKIIKAPCEGGTNAFPVSYFSNVAYLAESPQFYKQMAILGDFEKVYTIGSVFRAEDSNTRNHLTEFVGLDLEMVLDRDYRIVIDTITDIFKSIFDHLNTKQNELIETIAQEYLVKSFQYASEPIVLTYLKALDMLWEAGVEHGDEDSLSEANEKLLAVLVREKFGTDFFVVDKYPTALRPFYAKPDNTNPRVSNSFDMFMRGGEVLSGSERIHDCKYLQERAVESKIDVNQIKHYINAFKYGSPMHAGAGIGIERVTMMYLGIEDIRSASLFPRDPVRLTP